MFSSTSYFTPAFFDRAGIKSSFQSLFSSSVTPSPDPHLSINQSFAHPIASSLIPRSSSAHSPALAANRPSSSISSLTPSLVLFITPSVVFPTALCFLTFRNSLRSTRIKIFPQLQSSQCRSSFEDSPHFSQARFHKLQKRSCFSRVSQPVKLCRFALIIHPDKVLACWWREWYLSSRIRQMCKA